MFNERRQLFATAEVWSLLSMPCPEMSGHGVVYMLIFINFRILIHTWLMEESNWSHFQNPEVTNQNCALWWYIVISSLKLAMRLASFSYNSFVHLQFIICIQLLHFFFIFICIVFIRNNFSLAHFSMATWS